MHLPEFTPTRTSGGHRLSSCRLQCSADMICCMDRILAGLTAGKQMFPQCSRWTEPAQRPLQPMQAQSACQSTRAPEEQHTGCAAELTARSRQAITRQGLTTHHNAHPARRDMIQFSLAGTEL